MIAIIGVLAAIIIPVVGKVRQSADRAACSANLRRIGVAFLQCVQDNRGALPNVQFGMISANATIDSSNSANIKSFAGWLLPYLHPSAPPVTGAWQTVPDFVCPAWAKTVPNPKTNTALNSMVFQLANTVALPDGTTLYPFGRWYGPGMRLGEIPRPSATWMVRDVDQLLDSRSLVPTPVHGSSRNLLYFDGHVENQQVP